MTNHIHPTAIVGDAVELGTGNTIGPYAVLEGPMTIGDDNWIGSHSTLGTPSQWSGVTGTQMAAGVGQGVAIGDGNVIREYVTVHQGTDRCTTIEDETYLMVYAHVPHDALIASNATLTNSVQLAGHAAIGPRANVGLGTVVHQRRVIGAYAMIGMQSVVTTDVPPGTVAFGSPARVRGVNRIGLTRAGLSAADIDALEAALGEGTSAGIAALDEATAWFEARVAENAN